MDQNLLCWSVAMTFMPSHVLIQLKNVWHGLSGVTQTCPGTNRSYGLGISMRKGNILVAPLCFHSFLVKEGNVLHIYTCNSSSFATVLYLVFTNEHGVFHARQHMLRISMF